MQNFPSLFDEHGGVKRRALRQREDEERRRLEEAQQIAMQNAQNAVAAEQPDEAAEEDLPPVRDRVSLPALMREEVRGGGLTTTGLVAGDDADAKASLIAAVKAGGADALDAGRLARAHELEAMGFLQLTLAASEQIAWTSGFGIAR